MRGLTGWLVLVEENRLNEVVDEGSISSEFISVLPPVKKEEEVFLASFSGEKLGVIGLFAVTSVSERRLDMKPEIFLTQKPLEVKRSEIKSLEGVEPKRGIFPLDPEDYDRLREGLERLAMEESIGKGLSIPG